MIVPSSASKSQAYKCDPFRPAAIISPAALDTNSAKLLFEVSTDGTTFYPLYTDAGARYVVAGLTTNEARAITLDRNEMFPWTHFKIEIVKADGSTVQAQSANRIFTVVFDEVI